METLSISDTRANLKAVLDRVVADKAPIAISRQKGEGVVMISPSEWASIEENPVSAAITRQCEASDGGHCAGSDAEQGEEHELIEP